MKFQPVIKWSGSKRSQSEEIIKRFPKQINTYYEPFIGGASILFQLLHSDIRVNNYVCSDINEDLISLWNAIKNNSSLLIRRYEEMWNELNIDEDLHRKKQYYYSVRSRFNKDRSPEDFLFLSRTCVNGLIRYNSNGDFNTSFHLTRKGIIPKTLGKIILEWSDVLNKNNVKFIHSDYIDINPIEGDFIYLDPPYIGSKGMYYGTIDYEQLWNWLRESNCSYVLSFDGTSGQDDRTYEVPNDLYNTHEYIYNGCSGFKKSKHKLQNMLKKVYT